MAGATSPQRVIVKKCAGVGESGDTFFETQTPPNGTMPSYQQPDADESFFVLEGTYAFEIEGVRSELGPGSYVFVPRGTAHSFRNVSCAVARMLVMMSPGARPEPFFARSGIPEAIDVMLRDVA